jgi:site-specific DNA recombinase
MPGAVIYVRVSTTEQVQRYSLTTQEESCRAYCEREGLEVAHVFVEKGESAKTADRTELQRMLTYCRENKASTTYVVVYDLSRFSRETSDHYALKTLLAGWGVSLRSATQPIDDSPIGGLVEGITASVAQFENRVKAQRTSAGMRTALERGRWTFKPPTGYLRGQRGGPSMIPDPERAPLIREAFEDFASGRRTIAEIREHLRARGLGTWSRNPIALQTLHGLLRAPVYAGRIEVPLWGISVLGDFEGLVSEAVFNRVQVRLGRRRGVASHVRSNPDFPLRGLVRCSRCGTALTGAWSTGKSGRRFGYYNCHKGGCHGIRVRKDALEQAFLDLVGRLQPRREYVKLFNAIVLDVWRARQKTTDRERTRIRARVDMLRAKLRRLADLLMEDAIDRETYTSKRDKLRQDLALVETELDEAKNEQLDVEAIIAFAEDVLTNVVALWERASLPHKQRLQGALFPEGLVFEGMSKDRSLGFRTPVTGLAFKALNDWNGGQSGLVALRGFEPRSDG